MKEYAPEIVKLITQEVTPDEICTALGLCSSSKPLQQAASFSVQVSTGKSSWSTVGLFVYVVLYIH